MTKKQERLSSVVASLFTFVTRIHDKSDRAKEAMIVTRIDDKSDRTKQAMKKSDGEIGITVLFEFIEAKQMYTDLNSVSSE